MPERLDNFEFLALSFELRSPPSLKASIFAKATMDKPADLRYLVERNMAGHL